MNKPKNNIMPVVIGCIISVFLIVSFFLPRIWEGNATVESFNTVFVVCILCLCVHLVRKTSSVFYKHVWNNLWFSVLWLIPVVNLIIIACQFIWADIAFMQHPVFSGFLVLISLPAFCCYFFSVLFFVSGRDKKLLVSNILIDCAGGFYILFRLFDRSLFPLVETFGVDVTNFVEKMFSVSSYGSLVIYILALVNFIIFAKLFERTDDNEICS